MYRIRVLVAAALLLAACGSSSGPRAVPSTVVATTVAPSSTAALASSTAPASTTSVPATTLAASSTTAPAAAAVVVPEVLCIVPIADRSDPNPDDAVWFSYTNQGTVPVAVPLGPRNFLVNPPDFDGPLVPTVFAPGHVVAAFATAQHSNGAPVAWTVVGSDGVARTAAATAATPDCQDTALASLQAQDTRVARSVAVTAKALPEGAATPTGVEVTATFDVTGLTSRCPAGLDAGEPVVWVTGPGGLSTKGPVARGNVGLGTQTDITNGTTYPGVFAAVTLHVVDRCAGAGAVSQTWPLGVGLDAELSGTVRYCVEAQGATLTEHPCPGLPLTGGAKLHRANTVP